MGLRALALRVRLLPGAAMSAARSNTLAVSNPLTTLPSAERIKTLPPEARAALRALLLEIRADARQRAEKCWKKHKAPRAAYWEALSVYAGHTARLCK